VKWPTPWSRRRSVRAAGGGGGAQPNLERGVALTDVDRDGDTELAVTTGRQAGSFALEREERRWAGFRPFAAWPKVEGTPGARSGST
jgi:hypothetical protein